MSEHLGGGQVEIHHDPEVVEMLDFLETYNKIQEILSWLVESSASAPMLKGVRRAQLQRLMQRLGIDTDNDDDPGGYRQLADLKAAIADRSLRPQPRVEIPDSTFFEQRIVEVKTDLRSHCVEQSPIDHVSLLDVIRYGYTDWSEVQSRTGHLPTEIHRIACVMADPVAYHSWVYEARDQAADHIVVSEDWTIQNGRHRSLAAECLGEDFIHDSGMDQWIPVAIELSD